MTHFANLGHIKITSNYKKPEVIYGKSNTDQSYYEPTSSRIRNSYAKVNDTSHNEISIKEAFEVPIKPNGLTHEELLVYSNNQINNIKNDIKAKSNKTNLDKLIESSTNFVKQNTTQMNTEQN